MAPILLGSFTRGRSLSQSFLGCRLHTRSYYSSLCNGILCLLRPMPHQLECQETSYHCMKLHQSRLSLSCLHGHRACMAPNTSHWSTNATYCHVPCMLWQKIWYITCIQSGFSCSHKDEEVDHHYVTPHLQYMIFDYVQQVLVIYLVKIC